MKKYSVIIVAFFLLMWTGLQAQPYLGFKFGYNAGNTHAAKAFTNILPLKTLHGLTAGGVGGYNFNPYFALQAELNVTQKGFRITESKGFEIYDFPIDVGVDYWNRFTYLELPILAKGKIGNDNVKAYGAVGPQFGYLMKGRAKANVNTLLPITVFDRSLNLDNLGFKRFEVAGVAAAGVEFTLGPNANLFIEGRYTHGFTDYYKIAPIGTLQIDSEIQNRNLSGSIGITFNIGQAGTSSGNRF